MCCYLLGLAAACLVGGSVAQSCLGQHRPRQDEERLVGYAKEECTETESSGHELALHGNHGLEWRACNRRDQSHDEGHRRGDHEARCAQR
jgi:hypothetical protein